MTWQNMSASASSSGASSSSSTLLELSLPSATEFALYYLPPLTLIWLLLRYRNTAFGSRKPIPRITTDPAQKWPKGPPGSLLLGNQGQLNANAHRYLDQFLEWRRQYGLGYELTIPGHRIIEANHPTWLEHFQKTAFNCYGKAHLIATNGELQRTGIFTSDGHAWMTQRKAATHAFSRNHFKGPISDKLHQHLDILIDLLDNLAATGEKFDFQDVMARYTMLLSMSIAFSTHSTLAPSFTSDPRCLDGRYDFVDGFDNASPLIDKRTRNSLWKLTEKFDASAKEQVDGAIKAIYAFIEPLCKKRVAEVKPGTKNKEGDILDLFLEQERDPWVLAGWMVNILFAGRDTTAFSISWLLYELIAPQNGSKGMMQKARDEIESNGLSLQASVGDDHSGAARTYLDYDDQKNLTYLNALWMETIRIHPASARGMSICYEDNTLPAIPAINQPAVQVKKGDLVMWQDWVLARLPSIWGDDCEEFVPERFVDADTNSIKPISLWKFHGFNAGPRTCLGKNLATFDALAVLAATLDRYDFELVDKNQQVNYTTGMNMGIKEGLWVTVKRR
ncbi:uncharacterized protein PFL1_06338 [Pseudozyma flocculosa PF-1]|uniref:Cytochrome P450 n=2 Tax=Pseudozyma flocculosa TaxID=84751 RepID=A0A5C3F9Q2_9BASI|nr:uncharacterized protein PFL1_06338 [Pseudozyma flocculosa PF-1]EPQ26130.1 hypothetical protein PFL1_06338 [Pseudozyma flocculosa PF-1]SPO40375.1 uncharacterized protein PSFLO_05857 [Pseudozyma flocculosa]